MAGVGGTPSMGGVRATASTNEAANTDFLATRDAMVKGGLPEDYTDAMLDETYMETLIKATDHMHEKRKKYMNRYVLMNQAIVVFLVGQALLGIWLTLWGTVLAPKMDYSTSIELEDADMVVMIDGSNHLGDKFDEQRDVVQQFTTSLFDEIDRNRQMELDNAEKRIIDSKREAQTIFQKWFSKDPANEKNHGVTKYGGWLRVSTSIFNSAVKDIHPLTYSKESHLKAMEKQDASFHEGDSHWFAAMDKCKALIKDQRETARKELSSKEDFRRAERCYTAKREGDPPCKDFDKKLDHCPGRYCDKIDVDKDGKVVSADSESKDKTLCRDRKPFCRKQFCVIIGDSDAMCNKRVGTNSKWEAKVNEFCKDNPDHCPSEGEVNKWGNPVEWASEMQDCKDFSKQLRANATETLFDPVNTEVNEAYLKTLNKYDDINLIMIFTASTESERQMRLKSSSFRDFVFNVLNCQIESKEEEQTIGDKKLHYDWYYVDRSNDKQKTGADKNCLKFVMEIQKEELITRAKELKSLLEFKVNEERKPSAQRDSRWAFFLLLCLNIPMYLGWTYIVKWYAAMQQHTARAMGAKKKMIKVTKNIVEKAPDVIEGKAAPGVGELELQEFQKTKVPVEYGWDVTLRARLKGGYLRANRNEGKADGNGKAFERTSAWSFEPVEESDDSHVAEGQAFYIRNYKGQYLCKTANGTVFVDDVNEGGPGATQFVSMPCNDTFHTLLGDAIRLKNLGSGGFLKCSKEGVVDCNGDMKDPETQFIIDTGGQPVTSGALVTLHADSHFAWIHGTPQGHVAVGDRSEAGYEERDWRFWVIEKADGGVGAIRSMARTEVDDAEIARGKSDAVEKAEIQMDKVITRGALKEGDIITLKAFNLRMLEADEKRRKVDCCKNDDNDPDPSCTQEFEIHRMGISQITKHNNTIRRGCQVCLKPVHSGQTNRDLNDYVKVEDDGSLSSTGSLLDKEIVITIDIAPFQEIVAPLTGALEKGDAEVSFTNLEKTTKSTPVSTSAWTNLEDLQKITGIVVVADENGAYAPPKGNDPWVAVVQEGVDIFAAAQQAKSQGATGIIVVTDEACSQDRLALGADGTRVPELPCVFVHDDLAESLMEKGLNLKGGVIKKGYMTSLMRSIGKMKGPTDFPKVFDAAGRAMIERWKEFNEYVQAKAEQEAEKELMKQRQQQQEDAAGAGGDEQSKFKWKVNANTQYYWAKSGGGATQMKVNFGKKAPPSAHKEKLDAAGNKLGADASKDHHHRDSVKKAAIEAATKRVRLSVTNVPAEDVRNLRLAEELVMFTESEAQGVQHHVSELGAESDFKIEYNFEEIEVGMDENPEDLDEEAFMEDAGQVIKKVGVPKKYFYMVVGGLVATTLVLTIIVIIGLRKPPVPQQVDSQPSDLSQGAFAVLASFAQAAAPSSISDAPFMQNLQATGFLSSLN